uniref:Putative nuclear transport receptor ranbp7/ranbp8 importin beta superfamily n=1 Tax=Ornithodoros turicata TaxID=34597 RepID=A0A2R5LJV7_9ACAR
MDPSQLIEILRATIDPNQRENAEKQLEQVHKIIGFAPSLLQVVMTNAVDMPVRQAGAIYLKNLVMQFWQEREPTGTTLHFHVHEQDRAMVRDAIVDAMVHAPDPIRVQLAVCLTNILKSDFPGRWTGIVDKVSIYLQSPESGGWMGSVLALYQLVKNYEYKKPEEREPLREAMQLLLPLLYQRMLHLVPDPSEASVLVQKQILKVFFALVQYHLPLSLITGPVCTQWMEVFRVIIQRPVPDVANQVDEEERPDLPWWKCKKWAFHIISRLFERYGSPGSVTKEYREFADFYLKGYSEGILQVVLKVLDQYRQKIYVSPRVLQHALNYLKQAVAHAFTWKFLKPHIVGIILEVVFPLLCHTNQDDELWNTDPHEYIRLKFDVFEDFVSPVMAAQTLAHTVCKQRKGVLQKAMGYVTTLLTNPVCDPRQKDGALHLVGTVATLLLKRKLYKDQVEAMLVAHVLPEFGSPHGFLRARACWVLHHFCELRFRGQAHLAQSVECLVGSLLRDQDLPVRVEAAVALQAFLSAQEKAQAAVEPHIKEIALELLKIIRETENDDLITVMQKIVYMYTEQITPIAVEMTQHLVGTFLESGSGEGGDEKAMVAMGVLTTLDTLVSVLGEQQEIVARLEPPLLDLVVNQVLGNSLMEFYEEALSLLCSLSSRGPLSPAMWKAFEALYQTFQKDGFDFFADMMPALHNFVTVDTPAFVSNENHLLAMYNMCKALLEGSPGEDAECHAAKLLEVVILQCKGQIDQCIPSFVELVLRRLGKEITSSELTAMCLQVVIAALYYNPNLLFETLVKLQPQEAPLVDHFISMWMDNVDCFLGLHDRKMCVLGLCTLISTPGTKPQALMEAAGRIMPSMLMLFEGLKRAYAFKAQEEEDSDEEEEEDEYDGEVLDSDEDDVEDESAEYLARIARKAKKESPFPVTSATIEDDEEEEDEEDEDEDEETALEAYTTPLDEEDCPIDEYQVFKEVMQGIQNSDPTWFNTLTSVLNAEQQKTLQEIYVLADRRKAVAESQKIKRSGGYVFQNQTVPTSFNFGETSFNFGGAPKC